MFRETKYDEISPSTTLKRTHLSFDSFMLELFMKGGKANTMESYGLFQPRKNTNDYKFSSNHQYSPQNFLSSFRVSFGDITKMIPVQILTLLCSVGNHNPRIQDYMRKEGHTASSHPQGPHSSKLGITSWVASTLLV